MSRKQAKLLLYGTLTIALSLGTQGITLAEDSAAKTAQEEQQLEPSDQIPMTEIEVQERRKQELVIGQTPTAEGVTNYVVTRSSTGSKTEAETKDIPQTVTAIGQKVIEEQHADTVAKVLANVAGVNTDTGVWNPNANLNPSFYIRGFAANNYFFDGLYDPSGVAGWTGNLDRIEVLKGPSSLFFGQMQPGGIINYITKKPLTEEAYSIGLEYGSWGSRSVSFDASVPLTQDGKWLSRTIVSTDHLAQFQKNVHNNHFNGSLIVQGQPRNDTTYTFQAMYNHYNLAGGYVGGLPAIGTIVAPYRLVPYDANYYDPGQRHYFIGRALSARVDHQINDIWTVTSAVRYSGTHNDRRYIGDERWVDGDYTTGKILSYYSWDIYNTDTYAWDTTANAKFTAGGLAHHVTLGYEWSRYKQTWPISAGETLTPVDYLKPVFDPKPAAEVSPWRSTSKYRHSTYLADTVAVSDKLRVSGGLSHASYAQTVDDTGGSVSDTTYRVGSTYESSPGLTWFIGYGTSFNYNSSQNIRVGGQPVGIQTFKPKRGRQLEGGVKFNISDKASLTLSRYNIHQTNIITNLGTTADTDYRLIGEQASRGYELDLSYQIKPGWNLLAAYSNNDSTVVKNPQYPAWVGKQTVAVPKQTFRLWSTYEIQGGAWQGFGFGGGITHVSKRPFDTLNTTWVPGYNVMDAVVYYKANAWKYSLNVYNLANKKYYAAQTGVSVYAGIPRSFTLRAEREL
ncbi:TonB-dependent receptor|uniref:Iron complex outermembrane recepter protein n=1 Tax=Dendrosporobacter quercicolus TaxID=146817 RepID=A0A1G9TQV5_9FIRM|nr:TonB-dependent receptor [Dendrosporobacter quercicolus]NSL48881.1 TonB-dependent receptor [Dendrosporobacter quercicolus DSM 1736]SDM50156.1 iron complex outermembrane recepter protein [Dendrosporobacter quercicolus]